MSWVRDTGYLAGVPLRAIEGSLCHHWVHSPLCARLFSLHLNSSYPVSFLLTFVIFLTHFPSPLLLPNALPSLIPLSSLPFQSACYFTPSLCEKKEIGREARTIKHFSTFPPLIPFRFYPHVYSPLPCSLSFPRVESLLSALPNTELSNGRKVLDSSTVPLSYLEFSDSPNPVPTQQLRG